MVLLQSGSKMKSIFTSAIPRGLLLHSWALVWGEFPWLSVCGRQPCVCVQAHVSFPPHRSTWFGRLSQLRKGVQEGRQSIPGREIGRFFKDKQKERLSVSTVALTATRHPVVTDLSLRGVPLGGCLGTDVRPGSLNPLGPEAVGQPVLLALSSAATPRLWRPEALPQKTMLCLGPLSPTGFPGRGEADL